MHGIWPTKDFTIGPLFCNRSASFDFNEIQGILDQLKLHWTNVRANTELDNFWEHEWTKHGTCAMQLEVFNTELKYFSQGLALNEKFPLAQYLAQANIKPGKIYETKDVFEAVKKGIGGKNPALECQHMPEDFVKPVLTQIGICLDKNLSVIDCDKTHGGIYGKCPPFDFIEFPATEDRTRSGKAGNFNSTVECFPWLCFVVKTSADKMILQIFDIFSHDFSLFSTQLTLFRPRNSIGLKKD